VVTRNSYLLLLLGGPWTWVVWCRLDQKTCVKAVLAAGLELLVVPMRLVGDQLETDVAGVEAAVTGAGAANVCCVVTSTSCFAPRACDAVVGRCCCNQPSVGLKHLS